MASSDEDGEIIPDCVTNYYFVDDKDGVVSFSELPLKWSDDITFPDCSSTQIFLRGSTDDGLQPIYKRVTSWKFELSYVVPEFYVLSKDGVWLKLQQPRKSYMDTIKSTLVTIYYLHFIKRNPGALKDDVWNHLRRALSSLEVGPSENDVLVHKPLVAEAVNRDKDIAKSEYIAALLGMYEESTDLNELDTPAEKKFNFLVSDSDNENDNGNESDEEIMFDSVCSFCDNGGDVLCCEGRCMRSFHATEEAGADTLCVSLGYTDAQVDAIETFLCKNCQNQSHQCFACGLLGSSDLSSNPEVFPCVSATCGRFYHPKCVSKLLHPEDGLQADEVEKKIADGDSYICPTHKCLVCKLGEDRKIHDMQFAVCRRCPKAYHRKCLPRSIRFEGDESKNLCQRAWNDLLPNRILIYCMDHMIIPRLGTPKRNHIVFPGVEGKQSWAMPPVEWKEVEKKNISSRHVKERAPMQLPLKLKKEEATGLGSNYPKKVEKRLPVGGSDKRIDDAMVKSRKISYMQPQVTTSRPSLVPKKKSIFSNDEPVSNLRYKSCVIGEAKREIMINPLKKKVETRRPRVDPEMEASIRALMKSSYDAIDEKEFMKKQRLLSGASGPPGSTIVKAITRGKVEASMKAVEEALKKLEEGGTIEEAQAICEPRVIKQIFKWKNDLSYYLAPFLHGQRYTSFGRHFTDNEKLKEIVERLHWYVQEGDMIVDFCCGSNDFSLFMKEKLQLMGKNCQYKNYDLIQTKNDFNFEKRDWMSVFPHELPEGSRLIMGLNPPFGPLGAKAYKFVKKALTFKPKLLILIVPRETGWPYTHSPYDLIWEDDRLLAGKSFYLPGSTDIYGQPLEQWNNQTPPLYLWSRRDWTTKHKEIAKRHGHIRDPYSPYEERKISNYLMEENQDCFQDFSKVVNDCGDISRILDDIPVEYGYMNGEGSSRSSMPCEDLQHWNNYSHYDQNNGNFGPIEAQQTGNSDDVAELKDDMCMDMDVDMDLCTSP